MRIQMTALALCAALLGGCVGGKGSSDPASAAATLKAPITSAAAALDDVARNVAQGKAAAGREAYQVFASAFGDLLGPVSLKDPTAAQQMANANTNLQEALAHSAVDRAAVRREADKLMNGLHVAAHAMGVSLNATAAARLGAAAPEPARVIEVTAREYRFEPKVLHVKPGEQVTVRLRNAGTEKHEWEADGLHAEIKPVEPGRTGEVTFTAPMKPGTYEFACHVDEHYEKGMIGFVVVR